eukprot:6172629-Pleurochrysis_carterae.AAC.6
MARAIVWVAKRQLQIIEGEQDEAGARSCSREAAACISFALARQEAIPCMHSLRMTQHGALSLPIAVRVLAFGQLARLISPRARKWP